MKSFNENYQELQDQTGDDSAAMLVRFKRHINDTQDLALGEVNDKLLESTADISTVKDSGTYEIPANVDKIYSVTTLDSSGNFDQVPRAVEDPNFWDRLLSTDAGSSDSTQFYYQEGNNLLIWPDYSTASNTIRVRFKRSPVHMTLADHTTGTIESITNGAKALVGVSSPAWNGRKPLGEQWLRIGKTSGDFRWYKVASIDSNTTITFDKPYLGATISSATQAYTLGEFSLINQKFHNLLFYRPMAIYYDGIENPTMADRYWMKYDGGHEAGVSRKVGGMLKNYFRHSSGMLDSGYYAPQKDMAVASPEDLSRDKTFIFG